MAFHSGVPLNGFAQGDPAVATSNSSETSLRGRVSGQDEKGGYIGVIANARVEFLKADGTPAGQATANETGFYEIPNFSPGSYTYRVSAEGYSADDAGRGIEVPANADGLLFDFILTQGQLTPPKNGTLSGHAWEEKDGTRIPIEGARISAKTEVGNRLLTATTDEKGFYSFTLPSGGWRTSAEADGKDILVNPDAAMIEEETPATLDFIFSPAAEPIPPVSNKVYTLISAPSGPVEVIPVVRFVNRATGETKPGKVTLVTESLKTNAGLSGSALSGALTWHQSEPTEPLPLGTYFAEADREGFPTVKSSEKAVTAGEATWFDIAFVPERKPGDVDLTNAGKPVMPENPVADPVMPVTPVTPDHPVVPGQPVMPPANGPKPILKPELTITVQNSAGALLQGADLRLVDKTRSQSLAEAAQVLSDNRGVGSVILKDGYGDYALVASLPGYLAGSQELDLKEDPASPGTLRFERTITLFKEGESRPVDLTGVLVELSPGHDKAYKDGKKIPNARLTIQAPAGVTLPGILSTPLLTGTQGEFAAKALPEGTYTVSISAEGYEDFSGPLKVASGMEPLLLSLKPRNAASDNWIRMILTEGWGDLLPSRQFHESGTKAAPADSNVDYALGLSALQAKDKATSIPAFALAVGKVSNEKWWDRACEAHLWTLMHHQETTSAVSEIRRLIVGVYGSRAESDESRDTAFLCGVAVGVMKGPWTMEGIGQLDAEITAALKGTHLTSYEAGKQSVAGRFTQLSEAETKAKKDLSDAADGERTRMLADLEKRVQQLRSELDANTVQQQAQNDAFTNYRTTAEGNANSLTARLTELVAQADTLRTEIAAIQETMNSGMQAQSNRQLEELQGGLTANLAAQEAETQRFTTYRSGAEQTANTYVNRLTQISAELQQLAADFAKAQANPDPQMAGGGMARLPQIESELSAMVNQASLLTQRLNTLQEEAQAQINTYNTQLQQIANDQTARQTRVNEINAMPPYCPVCIKFAEKPADCQDCAQLRRDREAEVIRLNQEFTDAQAKDQEIRALSEGVQNNYNAAVATYNEQVAPMKTQEATLREEYNRLAGEANKTPAPNPMLAGIQKRDAALRTEYQETEAKHAALTAEYGMAEADYLTKINQLKETEAALRAQMANTPEPAPGAGTEAGLIAEKTAAYTRIQQEYQDVETKLKNVQADYLSEGGKHQQEIARLTELATTLTNQLNETVAQMGSLPNPGTMPAGAAPVENRPSMAFSTYFDYPLEQRRQELLSWVTRGANLGTPATR